MGRAGVLARLHELDGPGRIEWDAQGPYNGYTPLHDAVWFGQADAVRTLLELGVPTHVRGLDGRTPLDIAVMDGHEVIADMLRAAGSDTSNLATTPP